MMDESTATAAIDELFEFSAPCFFDFMRGESEEETRNAELWFEAALSYAPSPFMVRIKSGSRYFHMGSLCNVSEEDQIQKAPESSEDKPQAKLVPDKVKEEIKSSEAKIANDDKNKENIGTVCAQENGSARTEKSHSNVTGDEEKSKSTVQVETEVCTPKPLMDSQKKTVSDKKHQTAKKITSTIRKPSMLKPKIGNAETPNLALESQAIKRQKLDGGRSRQILNVKPHNFPHKSKLGLASGSSNLSSSTAKSFNKLDRKVYVREQAVPFVSMAEMMNKFQSCPRDLSLPHSSLSNMPTLKLTRPIEPELETAQRMRPVKVKSTAELEEEMMAKIPKFKARPLNKKIFEASTPLPSLPRSTPKPPEFQEFHLETMARASKNVETPSVASMEVSHQNNQWKPQLTEPKSPVLQTSLRAKPPKVKSSSELEQEELEKAPKFKARPLNKKIFESKGELGIFSNAKKQVTLPQEFHFATHERIPPPVTVFDIFDKLSLNSESSHDPIPRNTIPNPFHLHTEERGAEKEKKFVMEIIEKQFEEERARVPKANPYPYTTDYPVVPPKPEPKQCTKPEPFQLESLVRHEEEMKREMEERKKREIEEAQMRVFKALPVQKEDPIPVPEKVRKPLTQVEEFDLHVNHRAVDRAEFDQKFLPAMKVKEKAQKLKKLFTEDVLAGTSSKNILAMTFRQVVMQKLLSFELVLFPPGTERDMEDLENPREVSASFILRSSVERVISLLGEVVCISSLQSTERHFLEHLLGKIPSDFFGWFRKSKKIASKDSSVVLYNIFEDEIVQNAKSLRENFHSSKESFKAMDLRQKNYWWSQPLQSKLEKIGGHEFSAWTSEFVPAYRLEIDANALKDVKFEGWRESDENKWQVLLTHSQMVELADILDMYFEDVYSLPKKQLHSGMIANYDRLSKAKRSSSFLKVVSATIASGIVLITISTLSQFSFPHLGKGGKYPGGSRSPSSSSFTEYTTIQSVDTEKLGTFSILVIQKVKDAFGWPGDIATETNLGAWIGEIPNYLKAPHQANFNSEDDSTYSVDVEKMDDIKSSVQDIASYQVVLSTDGKIVGFQPTSRVGVNHWAVNPLTKELYGGKKLSPGLIEPRLNIQLPDELVVLELLMSVNPDTCFALARPIQ